MPINKQSFTKLVKAADVGAGLHVEDLWGYVFAGGGMKPPPPSGGLRKA
jgi:hypothetical protein